MPDDYGPEPQRYLIPVDRCHVDLRAQRRISDRRSQQKIKEIAANFSRVLLGSVIVTTTVDGWFNVIDGQKRIEAIRLINQQPDKASILFVPAEVNMDMSIEAQAATLIGINDRIPVNIFAKHRIALTAGDAEAHAIEALVASAGCRIPTSAPTRTTERPGDITCLKTLTTLTHRHDPAVAQAIVNSVADAYREELRGIRRGFIDAAERLLCAGKATQAELTAAFRLSTAAELRRLEQSGGFRKRAADAIADELHSRLAMIRGAAPMMNNQKIGIATLISRRVDQLDRAEFVRTAEERAGPPRPKGNTWGQRNPGLVPPKPPEVTKDRREAEIAAMAEHERTHGVTRCEYASPEADTQSKMFSLEQQRAFINASADRRRAQGPAFKP